MHVINERDLPFVGMSYEFIGQQHGTAASIYIVIAPPGRGPRLHRHPYDEIAYIIEGRVRWTLNGVERDGGPGDVLIVKAGEPHKFIAIGDTPLRQIDFHMNPEFVQENLE